MSGYRDDRRRSSRDNNNDRARERSPARRDRNHSYGRRDERQGYDEVRAAQYGQRTDDGGRGAYCGRGDYRGSDRGGYSQRSSSRALSSTLPDLPEVIPRPANGGLLALNDLPIKGTLGRPIRIALNHFLMETLPIVKVSYSMYLHMKHHRSTDLKKIYQYDLRFQVPTSSQRRGSEKVSSLQLAKVLLSPTLTAFLGPNFVFDGVALGWSPDMIMAVGESRSTTIDLPGHLPGRPNQVDVTMRNSGNLNVRKLVEYIKQGSNNLTVATDPAIEDCFKALNALYRQDPASRMITRPRSTAFFERAPGLMLPLQSTGGILEALRGIHQTIAFCCGKLTINVDVVVSAYYTPGLSAVGVIKAFAGIPPHQDVEQWASSNPAPFRQACERIAGMFFSVRHLNTGRNERKMRVLRVSFQGAQETEFEEQDHASGQAALTTVHDYFLRKYRINLQFPRLPLLIFKEGHFPMELCFTASGERYKEALQGQETADFIR